MENLNQYHFTQKELRIYEIYEAYQRYVQKRGDFRKYLPAKTDPRNSKNWKYFEEVYNLVGHLPTFDPNIFVEAQFRNTPKTKTIYPAQLKTKVAVQNYEEHRESLKIKDSMSDEMVIMNALASTYKFFVKWWKSKELSVRDYDALFKPKEGSSISDGMYFCIQGLVSKYFMAASRHFLSEYSKLDPDMRYEVIDPADLKKIRVKLRLSDEAWTFAHNIFGNEVYDG